MIIERRSIVDAPADKVWARFVTPDGINDELRPWMSMSMPRGTQSLSIDNFPVGTPIGRSWLRLFGVLPFDYDLSNDRRTATGPELSRGVDDAEHAPVAP